MKKRTLWTGLAVAAAAVILTSCGGSRAEYEAITESYDTASEVPAVTAEGAAMPSGAAGMKSAAMADYDGFTVANGAAQINEMEAAEAGYEDFEAAEAEAYDYDASAADGGGSGTQTTYENLEAASEAGEGANGPAAEKKLIRNVDMEVETTEFDTLLADIAAQAGAIGGYIENFHTSNYSGDTARYSCIVARVPSESLDGFLDRVSSQSNIIYRNESVRDVTLEYVDLDTHKKAMVTERDRLLELLEKADTVADIIEIESRLSEVSYEIESMEMRLRAIDNQVTYSTVTVNIYEVQVFTPVAEKSVWQRISDGFGNNVYYLLKDLENMAVGFVIDLPYVFAWIVVIVICLIVLRLLAMAVRKRRNRWLKGRLEEGRKKKAGEESREQGDDYEIIPTKEEKDGQDGTTV